MRSPHPFAGGSALSAGGLAGGSVVDLFPMRESEPLEQDTY